MQLLLSPQVVKRLKRELRRAGRKELGGLLMGEHLPEETFRVVEVSVQRTGGTEACFMRYPDDHKKQLEDFFARTRNDFARFNYLGEWHSHPSFAPVPSATDRRTMQSIVEDPEVAVNFLVLLVCKRVARSALEATATVFRAEADPLSALVVMEGEEDHQRVSVARRWRRFFRL